MEWFPTLTTDVKTSNQTKIEENMRIRWSETEKEVKDKIGDLKRNRDGEEGFMRRRKIFRLRQRTKKSKDWF